MDFDSMRKINAFLGSAGIMVMDEDTCMVKMLEVIDRSTMWNRADSARRARRNGLAAQTVDAFGNWRRETGRYRSHGSHLYKHDGQHVCVLADAAAMPTQSFLPSSAMNSLRISLRAAVPLRRMALWCISMQRREQLVSIQYPVASMEKSVKNKMRDPECFLSMTTECRLLATVTRR